MTDANDPPGGGAGSPSEVSLDETVDTEEMSLDEKPVARGKPPDETTQTIEYDPAKDRERKRGQIAMLLVWLLVGVVAGTFLLTLGKAVCVGAGGTAMCSSLDVVEVRTLIEMLLTPVVALVGAVTGFYFGESKG